MIWLLYKDRYIIVQDAIYSSVDVCRNVIGKVSAYKHYDVSNLLVLVKFLAASHYKRYKKNLCQDLLTIENTDLDLKVHILHSCKLAAQAETIRNYQKQVLVMIKHRLRNSQINSMP